MKQLTHILRESISLFDKIHATAKIYNFKVLECEIEAAKEVNKMLTGNLYLLNKKFYNYIGKQLKEQ